jgi:lauroyl/myristoyl acyltransferase
LVGDACAGELVAEELEPRALFESYRETRARLGISVLPITVGGLRKVTQALCDDEMVITAIDRDITGWRRRSLLQRLVLPCLRFLT